MKSLLVYLKDYKKESILAPLFKMLEASFELLVPLVMAAVIDVGIANQDKPYIVKMCFVLIALGLIGLTCSITAQYFSAKAASEFGTAVRHALFKHIQELTFTEMDTIGTSTLTTRMTSDINQVQSGVNLVLRLFLRSPFIVFGAMIMAFTVDVKAALVFVVVIPLLSLVVFGIMLITMPLYKKVQAKLDIVLRRVLLNQAAFQHQRLKFAVGQNIVKMIDVCDHLPHLGVVMRLGAEILADAVFEVLGFADIDDLPGGVFHQVDARPQRERHRLFAQLRHIRIHRIHAPSAAPHQAKKAAAPDCTCDSRSITGSSVGESGLDHFDQHFDRFFFVRSVRNHANFHAANDAERQHAQ